MTSTNQPSESIDPTATVLLLAPVPETTETGACREWLADCTAASMAGSVVGDRSETGAPARDSADHVRVDLVTDGALAADGLTLLDRVTDRAHDIHHLCVSGLDDVVRDNGTESAFRVLVALHTVVRRQPWGAHVHLDPESLGARTIRTLAVPVDAVIRFTDGQPVIVWSGNEPATS